jgi:subtilase family protein
MAKRRAVRRGTRRPRAAAATAAMVAAQPQRLLVKLRSGNAVALAADSRANLRPLFDAPPDARSSLGVAGEPRWFIADLPDGAETPWDLAHARVAAQLGIDESEVVFAEPDIIHRVFPERPEDLSGLEEGRGPAFAVGANCTSLPQNGANDQAVGPHDGWHLDDAFSQLGSARDAVTFADPRTRVAHLDTGYYGKHVTVPKHLRRDLQRSFVEGDADPNSAEDPDAHVLLDNSGHGTGTIGILAGQAIPALGKEIGGAPEAEVLPLRVADRVVLLKTSAFARALAYAIDNGCDVGTMSMGGLPSEAWRETVDRAYLAGLCLVTAAGNNFDKLPTRNVVYPARYGRVIAACGVMANDKPYTDLPGFTMQGNYGPAKVMRHALGAYTPNIPWAVFGCPGSVRMNGGGTSSATPQIAAAVALWFEKYKAELPRNWRRVEAVRHALFKTARKLHEEKLGHGILQAKKALGVRPVLDLPQTRSDSDSFAFLRVITGLGLVEPTPRERMFNLELAQRWLLNPDLQAIVPEPDEAELDAKTRAKFMDAVIDDEAASMALRRQIVARYPMLAGRSVAFREQARKVVPPEAPACEAQPALATPAYRRLRVYATDPSASTRLDTAATNEVVLSVPWEPLEEKGRGEYLAIEDEDPSGSIYDAVDLNDPRLLAQDGWAPSEGNPQFHQQMVYAVAMKTIGHFEKALGRPVLWRHRPDPKKPSNDAVFVPRLTIRPHALQQANAFYSPRDVDLKFGYFDAAADDPGDHVPGSRVYSCLSFDIVAHETTHAILDGMHRRFNEPSNPDVLALHEAFADIVALLQHFTIPELLESEIRRTRGDIEAESVLGSLAVQFGRTRGGRGALRDAIGTMKDGVWTRHRPDPAELPTRLTPHARGAILVAAVFDAFIAVYKARIADLLRISTRGTGVLRRGAIHPDLVHRLTDEAAGTAAHVLHMCIRALDYLPPVDVTFFEYLRALITADFDLVRDDRHNYRVAFVEAFRRRGIYPVNLGQPTRDTLRTLSVETLRWKGLDQDELPARLSEEYRAIVARLKDYADECLYLEDRKELFERTRRERWELHDDLKLAFARLPTFADGLGLDPSVKSFEVHELRPAMRTTPDGRHIPHVIVALTQSRRIDPAKGDAPGNRFYGGSTLVVDLSVPTVKYRIVKNIDSAERMARTAEFARTNAADPLRALFLSAEQGEPFAALHQLADEGL